MSLRQQVVVGLLSALLTAASIVTIHLNRRAGVSDPQTIAVQKVPVERGNSAAPATPSDWPQWRGPNRDGVSSQTEWLSDGQPQEPTTVWSRPTSGPGYSGLAVADGRLYTMMQDGNDEAVRCYNAESGAELWRFCYPAKFVSDQGSGPRSTPTVDGDRVYTVGATGVLHCLDAVTGELVWRRDLIHELGGRVPDWGVSFSPLVDGGLVFTHPGGPAGNSLAALDRYTGELRWKSLDDRPGYASPILTTAAGVRQVLFFTAEALVSVAPENGRLYWRYPWTTMMDCNIATPITFGDYVFISSGYERGCVLLRIVPKGGGALGVDLVYQHTRMRNHFSTSVLYDGHLYGFDESRLICMELLTGEVKWEAKGFRKGSVIVAAGHLVILGENGKLALAEATPARYREKARVRISRRRSWTPPILAGGKLYVRDQEEIICLDLKGCRSQISRTRKRLSGSLLGAEQFRSRNER